MNWWDLFLLINLLWFLSEILIGKLTFHRSKETQTDRNSLPLLWLTILPSIFIGVYFSFTGWARLPFGPGIALKSGLFLILAGLLLRWSAVLTLRYYFTSNVQILKGHQLVERGLYRLIRHPAYAGSLISFLGLGIALNSWLSVVVIFVPIFLAFSRRIKIEEEALQNAFGSDYQEYKKRSKKLIPFIY